MNFVHCHLFLFVDMCSSCSYFLGKNMIDLAVVGIQGPGKVRTL